MKPTKSQTLFAEPQRLMPGAFIASGRGARVVDVDGNEYIDYLGSWGPLVLGHAHPSVAAGKNRVTHWKAHSRRQGKTCIEMLFG